jgi:hypothetical protein
VMSQSSIEQRRNWFRFFPEGSLEFVVVTRVLSLLLMLGCLIVQGPLRPLATLALCTVLWIDYVLTQSWFVQLSTDLDTFSRDPSPTCEELSARRRRISLFMVLPATLLFAFVAPWPAAVLPAGSIRATAERIIAPACGLAAVLSLWPSLRTARNLQAGSSLWSCATLIPLLHWLGIHRLLNHMDRRICDLLYPQGRPPSDSGPSLAAAAADTLWIITVLPWLLAIGLLIVRGGAAIEQTTFRLTMACGSLLYGLFSVIDLAAMENVHRRFIRLIRGR